MWTETAKSLYQTIKVRRPLELRLLTSVVNNVHAHRLGKTSAHGTFMRAGDGMNFHNVFFCN